jgi:hypothetical protein
MTSRADGTLACRSNPQWPRLLTMIADSAIDDFNRTIEVSLTVETGSGSETPFRQVG